MTAVQSSVVARVTGMEFPHKDLRGGATTFLPQQIAVFGQGSTASTYSTTKARVTSALEVGQTYGFGSPLHLSVLQLLPTNGDGVGAIPVTVYPMVDDASGVASSGDITPIVATVAAEYVVKIGEVQSSPVVVAVGDTVATIVTAITAAINANVDMPMIATDSTTTVDLEAKWEGVSGNNIVVEVELKTTGITGDTWVITQPTGGSANPSVDTAITQIGDVWESLVLNCLDSADTTALTAFNTWGEGRWQPLVSKQAIVFTGDTQATVAGAITVPDARPTDRVNCQLVSPGANDLPFVVAARQLARIAVRANDNPAWDYGGLQATGLTPSTDAEAWTHTQRDQAVKGGSSTVEIKDGVVQISDVVTFYHPSGDPLPAYRFIKDIIRIQQKSFNLQLIFKAPEWDGAPLIPDDQPTTNPDAKKPKMAVAAIAAMLDGMALEALISDPETAKASIAANISTTNPNRLDISLTDQHSGNTNIKSITNNWGFFFGVAPVVG